ncbi:UNVERIFIED_CONTAM: protein dehydration-induced [Sesamum calycinum]|uniref:Protein dehydration-induced n=1 Tax=Sesamum calycinum TaxID=2727403 RepID=A0AAW2SC53_9LAMI
MITMKRKRKRRGVRGEEVNDAQNEEKSEELACPFCLEDFDVLGLCCHIDADHRMEVKPRICPVCAAKVGINMASHHRSTRSRSAIFLLRKELQEKHLRCIKESPCVDSSSDAAADSMLLSFVNNPEPAYRPQIIETISATETSLSGQSSADDSSESTLPSVSIDRKNEQARRCEFLQGLLLSTILDDL